LLVADPNGIKRLAESGPAIDSAVGSFPFVTVDLDGQPRLEPRDKGADEFSSAPVVARVLSPTDVGPNAAPSATVVPRAP
jgi:poly(beta-D-mannuronate) lyase